MKRTIKSSLLALLLMPLCAMVGMRAHAQATGGNTLSPSLSGCLDLNLVPALTNGPCGTGTTPGQLAGSVWTAVINTSDLSNVTIQSGADWVSGVRYIALPNRYAYLFLLTFLDSFVIEPTCLAVANDPNASLAEAGIAQVAAITAVQPRAIRIAIVQVPVPGAVLLPGAGPQSFTIQCTMSQ
jgi:hypothetical protein